MDNLKIPPGVLLAGCLLLSVSVSLHVQADTPDDLDEQALLFDSIPSVFTASKHEQKVTQAPASVSIVTAEEIARYGYRKFADILASVPGLYTSNDRNYAYVGVRGFGLPGDYNTRVLLLLDGQRLNDNVYDFTSIDHVFPIEIDMIDRVEIIRGPGSSLYGTNALFAVINVITKQGRDYKAGELSVMAGNNNSYRGSVRYGNKWGNGIEVLLSASVYDSEGHQRLYFPEFDTPATNNGVAENLDDEQSKTLFAKLTYRGVTLRATHSRRVKQVPTAPFGTVFNDPGTKTVDDQWYVRLSYQQGFDDGLELQTSLDYSRFIYRGDYALDYSDAGDGSFIVVNKDLGQSQSLEAELQLTKAFSDRHTLIAGLAYRNNLQQDLLNSDLEVYLNEQRDSTMWAIYAQNEYALRDNLLLNLGLRYDDYDSFGEIISPRLALIYNPAPATSVKLLYGEAFRAPNNFELYYHDSGYSWKAVLELEPETIATTELVLEQQFDISEAMNSLLFTASVYRNQVDELISLIIDPVDDLLLYSNIGEFETKGGGVSLEGRWQSGWRGRASYDYQQTRSQNTGNSLVNSPRHQAKLNLIAPLFDDQLSAGLELQYMSKRKTLRGAGADAHTLVNLTLSSDKVMPGLWLSASIYNLFDDSYGDPGSEAHVQATIPQDRRSYRLKVTYAF